MVSGKMRTVLVVLGLIAFTAVALGAIWLASPPPPGPALQRVKNSAGGLYSVEIAPEAGSFAQNELHAWVLTLKTRDGAPVDGAVISVDGGMPAHAHGLPTAPRQTDSLGEGRYRIDGVKFSMGGLWELRFRIEAPPGADEVAFNVEV